MLLKKNQIEEEFIYHRRKLKINFQINFDFFLLILKNRDSIYQKRFFFHELNSLLECGKNIIDMVNIILKTIKDKKFQVLEEENSINLILKLNTQINLNIPKIFNYILCEYNINKENVSEKIIDTINRNYKEHEKEIKKKCVYINGETKIFSTYDTFLKKRKNMMKILFIKNIKKTSYIFPNCISLIFLDLSNFNTSNVKDMSFMFYGCFSLTSLNLSKFDTNHVKDMSYMFMKCWNLTELNLSKFDTNNVENMNCMFKECTNLNSLNLSNFQTNNVINMSQMFYGCCSLSSLNLSDFMTSNVKDISGMFSFCSSLIYLDLSNFHLKEGIYSKGMFKNIFSECVIKIKNKKLLNRFNLTNNVI